MSRDYSKDDRYRPFSNGTEHMLWLEGNCMRGERGCRNYNPNASSSRHGCPIEVAIALAGGTGEGIPARIALRGDFLRPTTGGRLSDDHLHLIASDGVPAYCPPTCPLHLPAVPGQAPCGARGRGAAVRGALRRIMVSFRRSDTEPGPFALRHVFGIEGNWPICGALVYATGEPREDGDRCSACEAKAHPSAQWRAVC